MQNVILSILTISLVLNIALAVESYIQTRRAVRYIKLLSLIDRVVDMMIRNDYGFDRMRSAFMYIQALTGMDNVPMTDSDRFLTVLREHMDKVSQSNR